MTLVRGWIIRARTCWTGLSSSQWHQHNHHVVNNNIIIILINTGMITIITMTRVERQGRDLMERQKDVSKDSSKLGKEEVA